MVLLEIFFLLKYESSNVQNYLQTSRMAWRCTSSSQPSTDLEIRPLRYFSLSPLRSVSNCLCNRRSRRWTIASCWIARSLYDHQYELNCFPHSIDYVNQWIWRISDSIYQRPADLLALDHEHRKVFKGESIFIDIKLPLRLKITWCLRPSFNDSSDLR